MSLQAGTECGDRNTSRIGKRRAGRREFRGTADTGEQPSGSALAVPDNGAVRYAILGTTQARRDDGTPIALGGTRLRALLTVLALHPGRVHTTGALIEAVWDADPPADGHGALQALVGRLRRALGRDAVRSVPGGYRLCADPDDIDLHRFERLVAEGTRALDDGDPAQAAALLGDALALWRGPALADLPGGGPRRGPPPGRRPRPDRRRPRPRPLRAGPAPARRALRRPPARRAPARPRATPRTRGRMPRAAACPWRRPPPSYDAADFAVQVLVRNFATASGAVTTVMARAQITTMVTGWATAP